MPDWLQAAWDWLLAAANNGPQLPPGETVVLRVALAIVFGLIAAGLYKFLLGPRRKEARSLPTTLVLMAVLIAVVTMVIGNNQALAFGLVGALSIVRFRTVVDDTVDTSFVIFSVVLGMAAGTGSAVLAVVLIPAMVVAMLIMLWWDRPRAAPLPVGALRIKLGLGFDPEIVLKPIFQGECDIAELRAIETASKGAAVELTYGLRLKMPLNAFDFVNRLNKMEGVQGVEWKAG